MIMTLKLGKRLTLIASDPRISTALVILSVSRMLLIYLNYRFWYRMWKDTYAKFLSSGLLDRNRDTRTNLLIKYKQLHRPSYLEVYSSKEISMNLIFIVYSCFYECFWLFLLVVVPIGHEFLYGSYNIAYI